MTAALGPQALTWVTTLKAQRGTASLIWAKISRTEFTSYQLFFNALTPTVIGNIIVEASIDGGATYASGGWNGGYTSGSGATSWTTTAGNTFHVLATGIDSATNGKNGLSGSLFLTFSPLGGLTINETTQINDPPQLGGVLFGYDQPQSRVYPRMTAAFHDNPSVGVQLNALRFTSATGTWRSGSISIYGVNV